jgi:hypothetical protein
MMILVSVVASVLLTVALNVFRRYFGIAARVPRLRRGGLSGLPSSRLSFCVWVS